MKRVVREAAFFLAITMAMAVIFDLITDQDDGIYVFALLLAAGMTGSSVVSGRFRDKRRNSPT